MTMLEVDVDGWIAQNKGRELDELTRELVQNALDTGTDVHIEIDSNNKVFSVEDQGDGYSKLEYAWQVFGGDKQGDPTKRGRFSRGQKEILAGCQSLIIETTSGRVEFDVPERERVEDRDFSREVGTKVVATNENWGWQEMKELREYFLKFRAPRGQEITVSLVNGGEDVIQWEKPDYSIQMRIPTVKYDEATGGMESTFRTTEVEVVDISSRKDGRVYEMGIPIKTDCEFPFYVDVQQAIPMAEQRNEPDSHWYRSHLIPQMVEGLMDEVPISHKRKNWYTEAVDSSYDEELKKDYVEEVVKDGRKRGLVVSSDEKADDKAKQNGYQVFDVGRASDEVSGIVKEVAPTSTQKIQEIEEVRKEQVPPTREEMEFIDLAKDIAREAGYPDISFEMWEMEQPTGGDMKQATHENTGTIRFNRLALDWEKNAKCIGIVIHELAHEEEPYHDIDFINQLEVVAGTVVESLI